MGLNCGRLSLARQPSADGSDPLATMFQSSVVLQYSSLVTSRQQPHHHHRLLFLPYHLGSKSLLLAILPLVILSASLCSSSKDIFSSPLHRCQPVTVLQATTTPVNLSIAPSLLYITIHV